MKHRLQRNMPNCGMITLLLIVGVLAVGVLIAGIAGISSSSTITEIKLNQANSARNLAESGVLYAKGLIASYENQGKTIDEAITALNNNGGVVTVGSSGSFVIVATKSGGNIVITSTGKTASALSNYIIPQSYTLTFSESQTKEALQGTYTGLSATMSGKYYGSLVTSSNNFNEGVTISGSIDYVGSGVNSYGDNCLHIKGSSIGTNGEDTHVCSDTCVIVDGAVNIYSDIYAQGDVIITNGHVYGDIHSGGNVSLTWSGSVKGSIYAHGTFTKPTGYLQPTNGTVKTGTSIPAKCVSYPLPAHESVASTKDLIINQKYTFYGTTDLNSHSLAYSSIKSSGGSMICFDLSTPNTYINIFNSGNMDINGDIYVRTSASTQCFDYTNRVSDINAANYAEAKRVYMDVLGKVTFNGGSNWFGTVYAGGNISPGGGGKYIGAFYTNGSYNPENHGGIESRFVQSDYVLQNW